MVDKGIATAEESFAAEPRKFALCGVDTEEAVFAVCLVVLYRYSGPVKENMATEGVEV